VRLRFGLGPVFVFEWLMVSRRWQIYAARSLFVAAILAGAYLMWLSEAPDQPTRSTLRAQALIGERLFYTIMGIQLVLVLLAAPAYTAGAVCLDKARGALVHLLVTDLSNAEIVLGKLAARLAPVLGLVGCCVPIVFLSLFFGGIQPDALIGAFLVTIGVAVLCCTLALTLSVWAHKTYEVLLATYMIEILMLLANPGWKALGWYWPTFPAPPRWYEHLNVFWVAFGPYLSPGAMPLSEQAGFLGETLVVSAVLAFLAVVSVRRVTIRQSGRPQKERRRWQRAGQRRWLPGPSLDSNPVLWREWHRRRPSRWTRAVWALYTVLAVAFSVLAAGRCLSDQGFMGVELAMLVNTFQVSAGLLLMSVASVTALADERVRGSLDVLLVTPLSSVDIAWGKWWGAFRRVPWLAVLPGLLGCVLAVRGGRWGGVPILVGLIVAYGVAITSLGLALATWIARLGRAVALSVTAYVLVSVGWIFVLVALFPRGPGESVMGLASLSPFYGVALLCEMIGHPDHQRAPNLLVWDSFWMLGYCVAGLFLFGVTVRSFDRCLGRITLRHALLPRVPQPLADGRPTVTATVPQGANGPLPSGVRLQGEESRVH
jgi:ABC-type transport system involved in multi-copper enzyme maturation permease subunit